MTTFTLDHPDDAAVMAVYGSTTKGFFVVVLDDGKVDDTVRVATPLDALQVLADRGFFEFADVGLGLHAVHATNELPDGHLTRSAIEVAFNLYRDIES